MFAIAWQIQTTHTPQTREACKSSPAFTPHSSDHCVTRVNQWIIQIMIQINSSDSVILRCHLANQGLSIGSYCRYNLLITRILLTGSIQSWQSFISLIQHFSVYFCKSHPGSDLLLCHAVQRWSSWNHFKFIWTVWQ